MRKACKAHFIERLLIRLSKLFFFEDETESFEKYRDDLVEQLRKFVEDVQGELGLSKI